MKLEEINISKNKTNLVSLFDFEVLSLLKKISFLDLDFSVDISSDYEIQEPPLSKGNSTIAPSL